MCHFSCVFLHALFSFCDKGKLATSSKQAQNLDTEFWCKFLTGEYFCHICVSSFVLGSEITTGKQSEQNIHDIFYHEAYVPKNLI